MYFCIPSKHTRLKRSLENGLKQPTHSTDRWILGTASPTHDFSLPPPSCCPPASCPQHLTVQRSGVNHAAGRNFCLLLFIGPSTYSPFAIIPPFPVRLSRLLPVTPPPSLQDIRAGRAAARTESERQRGGKGEERAECARWEWVMREPIDSEARVAGRVFRRGPAGRPTAGFLGPPLQLTTSRCRRPPAARPLHALSTSQFSAPV
jgi:hypothetical protein